MLSILRKLDRVLGSDLCDYTELLDGFIKTLVEQGVFVGWTMVPQTVYFRKEVHAVFQSCAPVETGVEGKSFSFADNSTEFLCICMHRSGLCTTRYFVSIGNFFFPFTDEKGLRKIILKDIQCIAFDVKRIVQKCKSDAAVLQGLLKKLLQTHSVLKSATVDLRGDCVRIEKSILDDTVIGLDVKAVDGTRLELMCDITKELDVRNKRVLKLTKTFIGVNLLDVIGILEQLSVLCVAGELSDSTTIEYTPYILFNNWKMKSILDDLNGSDAHHDVICNRMRYDNFHMLFENDVYTGKTFDFFIPLKNCFKFNHVDPRKPDEVVDVNVPSFAFPFFRAFLSPCENLVAEYNLTIFHGDADQKTHVNSYELLNIDDGCVCFFSGLMGPKSAWWDMLDKIQTRLENEQITFKLVSGRNDEQVLIEAGTLKIWISFNLKGPFRLLAQAIGGVVLFDVYHFHYAMILELAVVLNRNYKDYKP
jgi:hypothetical protein